MLADHDGCRWSQSHRSACRGSPIFGDRLGLERPLLGIFHRYCFFRSRGIVASLVELRAKGWDLMMERARLVVSKGGDRAIVRCVGDVRHRPGPALKAVDEVADTPASVAFSATTITEADVRAILTLWRSRSRFFAREIFADPAWDILLELYAAELGQRRMSIDAACACAAVPATTALRWIRTLEENQLVRQWCDPLDGRRLFLSLTDAGLGAMSAYFETIPARTMPV